MKKALLAATIVGVAAAGVILYLTRGNGSQRLADGVDDVLDEVNESAEHGRRMASRLMREGRKKMNNMVHETME